MITQKVDCDSAGCLRTSRLGNPSVEPPGSWWPVGWLTVNMVDGVGHEMPTVHFCSWKCLADWAMDAVT